MTTPVLARLEPRAWRLDDLFPAPDSDELAAALDDLERAVAAFEELRPLLQPDIAADVFVGMLRAYEQIVGRLRRIGAFAYMNFSADTQNQEAQTFLARTRQLEADAKNRILFFELWWKLLPEAEADRLVVASSDYRYWLETLRREKPHTLREAEEQIVNAKNANGREALQQLYESITGRYRFEVPVDGELRDMAYGELTSLYPSPDPAEREAAYRALLRVYAADDGILGQIYQALVRDWHSEFVATRRFASPIAVRNLRNDLPDEVVAMLLDVIRDNAPLFQRYFQLKARWLGVPQLRRFDIYAPITAETREFDFATAVELVLSSYRAFDPRLAQLAQRVFDAGHFDGEDRPGKSSSRYCSSPAPELTPWIHQAYYGRVDDVSTMAHELGHAVHSMLAAHHTVLNHWTSMPLAETASIFGEMLLTDYLLANNTDPALRSTLLFRQMDDAYMSVMRQGFFAMFEEDAHAAVQAGASVADLSEIYMENLKRQFGTAVAVDDAFRHEWVLIPHFYEYPFYVYAYAFGQLLVLALYEQYRREGAPFKQRLIDILAAGGSDAPLRILAAAGIDVTERAFWQGGFDRLAELLAELEALPVVAVAT